ncbi:MAG: hypothetical protein ACFFD1_03275 [Candidatus Thorarchaeota archaeon]
MVIPKKLSFLSKKEAISLIHIAEIILGIPKDKLGEKFIEEADHYLSGMPKFFSRDLHLLFFLFNSRIFALIQVRRFKKFTAMNPDLKLKFAEKWAFSRIPLMRTGFNTLKSISGWAFYSLEEKIHDQIPDYPGKTLGREKDTPTLLFNKENWQSEPELMKWKYIKSSDGDQN